MRTKHLFYTLALSAAFAACSQEEIVNAPVNQLADSSFANYSGEVFEGNITFTKDGEAVDSRMAIENGTPSWADGDKVGLVWTNAEAGIWDKAEARVNNNPWTAWPTTNKIFSNTRMTYDANTKDFFMTDGQVFKGMYFAYYPFNEEIQSVQQFKVAQSNVQEQTNITTETLNQVATDLVWMSQRYEDNEEVMTPATFLYPLTEDNVESGVAKNVNIRMKPFSNILDARFLVVDEKDAANTSVDPKEVVVKKVILGTRLDGAGAAESQVFGGLADIPTVAAFALNEWQGLNGSDFGIPSSGQSGLDGRKLTVNSVNEPANGFYVGESKVGAVTVSIANEAANAGKTQRVNFMFLPHKNSGYEKQVYEIKVLTDYGWAVIPETEWMKTATNQGGLYVNPNAQPGQVGLTPSYQLKNLTDRIGMQAVRYFNLDIADLVYNDIEVSNMEELTAALKKWNDLAEDGEFRVIVTKENNFENFDWSSESSNEEIREFIADEDVLVVMGKPMNLSGTTTLNDVAHDDCEGHLEITVGVTQTEGEMNVLADEDLPYLTVEAGAALNVEEDATLTTDDNANLRGEAVIDGTLKQILPYASVTNSGTLTVNGTIDAQTFATLNNSTAAVASTGKIKAAGYVNIVGGELEIAQNGVVEAENMVISPTVYPGPTEYPALVKTNGIINVAGKLENNAKGVFRIKTFSETNVNEFKNAGKIYYDEQGKKFKYTNVDGGKSIATIQSGDNAANTLADYIINANEFKCTDLVINPNDHLTTGQWDNSLNDKNFGFKTVVMNDGVTIQFNKNLNMSKATVEIPADATVEWKKGDNLNTPEFTIYKLAVNSGSTLNVSDIYVVNAKKTDVNFGNEGKTVTINGMSCFAVAGTTPVGTETNGTIVTKP